MNEHVLLYTPGIDTLLVEDYLTRKGITPEKVYYDIKSKYSNQELEMLDSRNNVIIDSSFNFADIEDEWAYIPNRNLHFALHASATYGNTVWVGGTQSDRVSDNNKEIFSDLGVVINKSLPGQKDIRSPFWDRWKSEIVAEWIALKGDPVTLLTDTFSCYFPKSTSTEHHGLYINANVNNSLSFETYECLQCRACFRKSVILFVAGISRKHSNDQLMTCKNEFMKNESIHGTPRYLATLNYINYNTQ
jgi:7-cyano-7-deazaguanine synthase in queuosine biosynthesis